MAAETAQPKQPAKQAKDDPQIEVKDAAPEAKKDAGQEAKKDAGQEAKKDAGQEARKDAGQEKKAAEGGARVGRAEAIIRRNVLWSLAAGIVPFPLFDLVAVSGVQMKMLAELSELYEVKFRKEIAKKILSTLFSSVLGVGVGTALGLSISKLIPTVGTALGLATVPLVSAAFTHATGKVFLMHFESGGTLLDFDPRAMRSYFKQEFEKAKETVTKIQEEEREKAARP